MLKPIYRYLIISISMLLLFSCKNGDNKDGVLIASKLSTEDSSIINKLENNIVLREFDQFFESVDSIKKSNKFENVLDFRYNVLIKEATAFNRVGKYEKALEILNDLIEETSLSSKFQIYYIRAILLKGDIYFLLGNYQIAYKYLYDGKIAAEKLNNQCQLAQYDYRLGIILYNQEKYLESINFFKQSFQKYNSCDKQFIYEYRQQEILSNIGLCYYKFGVYDSSIYYYKKSIDLVKSLVPNDSSHVKYIKMAEGVISGNTGKAYAAKKKYDEAIPYLVHNINVNILPNLDYVDALTSVYALAQIYRINNDDKNFLKTIAIAEKYENATGAEEQLYKIYQIKSDYYKSKGNFKEAFTLQAKSIALKDSLDKLNNKIKNSDILLSIESLENENQLNMLRKENDINQIYFYIAVIVSIVFIIGLMLSYIVFNKFKARQKELEQANTQISEQTELLKLANDEILKNIDVLKKRDIEKNRIMNMLAHDLQSPNIQVINIIKELLSSDSFSTKDKELLKNINSTLLNNNDLVQEILLFSKTNGAMPDKQHQVVVCNDIINQVIDTNYFKAKQKNIELVLKFADNSAEIFVNQENIRRALSNIVQNAIKFSHRNTKISIFTTSTKDIVNIHIKDEGIGIPDRIKSMVFDSDPLVRRLGTEGEPTFGLGLTLVKQIVEDHSGHLTFNSDVTGTEFIISLPIYKQNK